MRRIAIYATKALWDLSFSTRSARGTGTRALRAKPQNAAFTNKSTNATLRRRRNKRTWVHWAKKQKKRRRPSWQMDWEDPYRLLVLRKPAASEKLQGRGERPLPHFWEFPRGSARRVQQKSADKPQNNSDTSSVPQSEGLRRTPLDAGDVANRGGWGAVIVFNRCIDISLRRTPSETKICKFYLSETAGIPVIFI